MNDWFYNLSNTDVFIDKYSDKILYCGQLNNCTFDHYGDLIDCINADTFNINAEMSFTLKLDDSVQVNDALLQQLCFGNNNPNKVDLEYYIEKSVPAKRNKKRRIQKKWIKRYGYKTIREKHTMKDMTIAQINDSDFIVTQIIKKEMLT